MSRLAARPNVDMLLDFHSANKAKKLRGGLQILATRRNGKAGSTKSGQQRPAREGDQISGTHQLAGKSRLRIRTVAEGKRTIPIVIAVRKYFHHGDRIR